MTSAPDGEGTLRRTPTLDDLAPQSRRLLHAILHSEDEEIDRLIANAAQVCPAAWREVMGLLVVWKRERDSARG